MGPIIAKFFWVPSYKKKSQTKEETITSMHCKVISLQPGLWRPHFTLKGICFRAKAEELGVLSDYGRILIKGKKIIAVA